MKRKYFIAALVASCILMIGCGTSSKTSTSATTAPSTTVYKNTTTTSSFSMIDIYVATMKEYFPGATRSDIIDVGQKACATIDAYGSVKAAIAAISVDPDFAGMQYEVGIVIGSSIPAFCPEYQAELNRL